MHARTHTHTHLCSMLAAVAFADALGADERLPLPPFSRRAAAAIGEAAGAEQAAEMAAVVEGQASDNGVLVVDG